jgi:hypothetical protein
MKINIAITARPASLPPSMWHVSDPSNPNSLASGGRTNLDEIDLERLQHRLFCPLDTYDGISGLVHGTRPFRDIRLSDPVCNRRPFSERLAIVAACMKESDPGRAH